MGAEADKIRSAVDAVNELVDDDEEALDPHVRWQLRELLDRVKMSDLTATEAISIVVILARVHSRVIRCEPAEERFLDGRRLRLVD